MSNETNKQYWSMTEGVFNCLIDKKRTVAFQQSILNTVKDGDVVIDMGSGTGVLAMIAARAGASKVYAIEIDENNIRTLEETFKNNGFQDTIEVIKGNVLTVKIPEKADVVIGEMIATALIEELQLPAMNHILQYTKPGVKVLLNKYETYVDLVYSKNDYYDFRFEIIRYEYPDDDELKSKAYTEKQLVASYDFSGQISNLRIEKKFLLSIASSGVINAVRLSGKTTFYDNSTLDATFAYDYPLILPIEQTDVVEGSEYELDLCYEVSKGLSNLRYLLKEKQI